LLAQGFEEGKARRALRIHRNDTQAALDWLINGSLEESNKSQTVSEGVRMPTTVKRVQRFKAARKARQEKFRQEREGKGDGFADGRNDRKRSDEKKFDEKKSDDKKPDEKKSDEGRSRIAGDGGSKPSQESVTAAGTKDNKPVQPAPDLMNFYASSAPGSGNMDNVDLLNFETREEVTHRNTSIAPLSSPPSLDMFGTKELAPSAQIKSVLPGHQNIPPFDAFQSSLPSGGSSSEIGELATLKESLAPAMPTPLQTKPGFEGVPPELMSMVEALAAQSNVTPQQLLLTAQQLAGQSSS